MASHKAFQKIFDRYRKEDLPLGVSIVDFYLDNGVVYKQYERWLNHHQKIRIHPVQLTDMSQDDGQHQAFDRTPCDDLIMPSSEQPVLFNLRLVINRRILLQHRDLDYEHLVSLITKLEVLC